MGPLDRLMNSVCGRILLSSAEDITETGTKRRSLVLAPHPDDEVLGCGAFILRKRAAGTAVRIVFASDGRHSHPAEQIAPDELARRREAEAAEACSRLGVAREDLDFLRLEDGTLRGDLKSLCDRLAPILKSFAPEELLVPFRRDGHRDHEALWEAAMTLRRDGTLRAPILEYPVWFWQSAWWRPWMRGRLSPEGPLRVVRVRTEGFLDRKREALAAHRSQMEKPEGKADWSVLSDADGGRFLERFFGRYEPFFTGD